MKRLVLSVSEDTTNKVDTNYNNTYQSLKWNKCQELNFCSTFVKFYHNNLYG